MLLQNYIILLWSRAANRNLFKKERFSHTVSAVFTLLSKRRIFLRYRVKIESKLLIFWLKELKIVMYLPLFLTKNIVADLNKFAKWLLLILLLYYLYSSMFYSIQPKLWTSEQNNFRFSSGKFGGKHRNQQTITCQVLAELNKIWSCLIFIKLYNNV